MPSDLPSMSFFKMMIHYYWSCLILKNEETYFTYANNSDIAELAASYALHNPYPASQTKLLHQVLETSCGPGGNKSTSTICTPWLPIPV